MKSPVVKRSIVVAGHKTSVSLEEAFWNGMKEISSLRNMTLSELVGDPPVRARLLQEPRRYHGFRIEVAARLTSSQQRNGRGEPARPRFLTQ
jgi:hypothetical protein